MKLLSGNSNKPLSKNIAKYLKSKLVNSSIRNFSDGEIYVEINENIRGNSIFNIGISSSSRLPTNTKGFRTAIRTSMISIILRWLATNI